jgi:hypothetical protein
VPRKWPASAILGLFAGAVSVVVSAVYFVYWWALPDFVWETSVVAALAAVLLGIWATIRTRRYARLGGVVAIVVGPFVVGYSALILTYE